MPDLTSLSLEDLMKMDVTSVSKTPENRFRAPAAVYVITQEDIRRSGVTSIPEALRLAPGVEVARINANQWSIGVRGFGSRLARYTLVLIDGRSVYDPLFAGTYWEVQDTLLEDIDRIEVIRGPGGALWGSNAVNGVINIITKSARETHGSITTVGGGSEERSFAGFRYGGQRGDRFHYRVYGKYFDRDESYVHVGEEYDDWQQGQAGFRTDWNLGHQDDVTIQGDTYKGRAGQRITSTIYTPPYSKTILEDSDLAGANVLARWKHDINPRNSMALQFYYDHTDRTDPDFEEARDTYDLDFQQSLPLGSRNSLTYGSGFRVTADDTRGTPTLKAFTPASRTLNLVNFFAQDQIALIHQILNLTLGAKWEHNDYTGSEFQPNGRLAWTPTETQTLWGAISKAVRTPSRVDRNPDITVASVPTPFLQVGRFTPNEKFESENLIAYEAGYRIQPKESLFFGVDGFYNDYDDVYSLNINPLFFESNPAPTKLVFPFIFENRLKGKIYGGEANSMLSLRPWWRLEGVYSFARINLHKKDGTADGVTEGTIEGGTPWHQVVLRSSMELPHGWEVDPTVRYVSQLRKQNIPAYWTMDLHLGWHGPRNTEVALVGQNLLQRRHAEASGGNEIQRGVYGRVTWRYGS